MGGNNSGNKAKEIKQHVKKQEIRTEVAAMATQLEHTPMADLMGILEGLRFKVITDALKEGDVVKVLKLVTEGQYGVNERLGDPKTTPIHLAAHLGQHEILRALISLPEADLNTQDKDGDTPLMLALFGADTDAESVIISGILISDPRCDITKKNNNGIFPLCVAIKRGYKETCNLLLSKARVKKYPPEDMFLAVKIAMMLDQEGLADMIIERLDKITWLAIAAEMGEDPRMAMLQSLLQVQLQLSSDENKDEGSDDETVTDSTGQELRKGNTVKCLSLATMKRENPNDKEEFLEKIANKRALIQGISGTKIIMKILDDKVMGKISAKSVLYVDNGPRQAVADGSNIGIGSYVKVFADEATLKTLSKGHGGYNDQMHLSCGKTGRVLEIDKDSDVLVGFAWGKIFFFNPKALLPSSSVNVETMDSSQNWLRKGCAAKVTQSLETFVRLQQLNKLPIDEKHKNLVGKFVFVQRPVITPYSKDTDVIVVNQKQPYGVNAHSLTLVGNARDHNGKEMILGSEVKMLNDRSKVEALQTPEFGNWSDSMEKVLGVSGKLTKLEVNIKFDPTDVVVQVKFSTGSSYYVNPKALLCLGSPTSDGASPLKVNMALPDVPESIGQGQPNNSMMEDKDGLQMISRLDLLCAEELGGGAFGRVKAGSWKGTSCAIKQIKSLVTNSMAYEDIVKEAKIHYSLKHPNIVQLYGISLDKDLWMVMQIVKGWDLYTVIFPESKEKPSIPPPKLDFKQKLRTALQIANGISYIHDRGFLHGDIKPHNMMLERTANNDLNLYICDFGISRYLGPLDRHDFASKYTNNLAGTLYYLAPECLTKVSPGAKKYRKPTFKADVWAIAAVYYELFTEKQLFEDHGALFACKYLGQDDHLKRLVQNVDSSIRLIVDRGLVVDPEQRPTAKETIDFLFNVLKSS